MDIKYTKDELAALYKEDHDKYMELWNDCNGKAEEIVTAAVKLMQFEPAILTYFGLCDLKNVKDPEVTLRLNCRGTGSAINMEYNPIWLCKIEEPSILAYIIFSECLRIALHHITTRKCYPLQIFKKSSDYISFDENQRSVLNTHKQEVMQLLNEFPNKSKFKQETQGIKFNEEEHWFLEKVFSMLMEVAQQQQQQSGGAGQGEGESDSQDGKGNSQKGQGKGNGNDKQKGKGGGSGNSTKDALGEYFDNSQEAAEKATEGWEENTLVDQEIQEITHHIAESASQWGNISGGLLQAILAANTPKFDPRTVLKRFKANTVDKYTEDTRMRPDRRKAFDVPGKKHKFRSRILVAIDCSGSMSDEDVERGCAIVNKFVKHADVSYCFWDGVCGPFTAQKQKKTDFKLIGRGCTNPDCVLDAIKERKAKFDGIIYFTDMGFTFEKPEHYFKKIFMISTPGTEEYIPDWCLYHLTTEQLFSIEE
jgi:predicted metal-dependent peptidase